METSDQEKRAFKRGPLLIPVRYEMQGEIKKGYMTDLSKGGCRLYCYSPTPVEENNPTALSFTLKNSADHISVIGQVVRASSFIPPVFRGEATREFNYELGIRFLGLNEKQGQEVENFISLAG
ncbi:MAG TPA: PilZ domain-containing protein [Thermodesulfobacteriota bacterium]|nr:PilZ domain-containing protein [Thermodesulfobacteriota bacterium]